MWTSLVLAIALFASAIFTHPTSRDIAFCGDQPYETTWSVCYNNSTLCPIHNGLDLLLCGNDCFNPLQYSCNNYTLFPLPVFTGAVVLTAVNPRSKLHGQYIQASGTQLVVGGNASSYCPTIVKPCPEYFTTVLRGSSLSVMVPGGQAMYMKTDGSVAYTMPHSASMPDLLSQSVGVSLSNAGYWGVNGSSWLACKVPGSDERPKLHADLKVTQTEEGAECEGIFLKVDNQPSGTIGAWEYT